MTHCSNFFIDLFATSIDNIVKQGQDMIEKKKKKKLYIFTKSLIAWAP